MSKHYEWNQAKNHSNRQKHGIGFETAKNVFDDPNRIVNDSPRHGEARWKTVGLIFGVLFTVVYTIRRTAIRLISARRASRREARAYRQHQVEQSLHQSNNRPNHDDH